MKKKDTKSLVISLFHELNALNEVHTELERKIRGKLTELLEACTIDGRQAVLLLTHECGIKHYACDFNDEDSDGVAKTKPVESITYDKEKKSLKVCFEDGTTSDNFAVDDWGYLWEDASSELQYLEEELDSETV